jgi:hypothetical protein
MKCYPLGIGGLLAVACDCIRRGDLDGAQLALARATALSREDHSRLASSTKKESDR